MDDGILASIKKMLGLDEDYHAFDTDVIIFINSALMTLQQLGVGPVNGYSITDASDTWSSFLQSDMMLEGVKEYVYICVRIIFDPPTNSFVMDALQKKKEELEWRLREQAEFYPGDETGLGYWQKKEIEETETGDG